jgi:hypothetical protein
MSDAEIAEKKDPALRLPRQAEHYSQIVGHFLAVKNSREIAGAIQAHFERLQKYHRQLLGLAIEVEGDSGEDCFYVSHMGDRVTYDRSAVMPSDSTEQNEAISVRRVRFANPAV